MTLETWVAASVGLIVFTTYLTHNRTGLPRVGKAGPIGFILTAFKSITSFADLLEEGLNKYGGKAFVIPTMAGSRVIIGVDNVEKVKNSDDSIINQPLSVVQALQLTHTMNSRQQALPYQAVVARTDITRAISSFIPEVLDETRLSISETFAPKAGESEPCLSFFRKTVLRIDC
ncbi:hypothetical protein MVEN_01501200 [Mycena venus]|uniref:Cytochrome P450 n=1 Tax=Mycena venus TaxID=2733690 RepID=A0A8H6XW55_9AGAR|nr:hypothetical protein MVEN_01501200 [Mycena venus]